MTLNEKTAYLKGLAEGMKLSESNPAEKLTLSMIDLLKDIAETLTNIDGDVDLVFDELEELRDELDDGFAEDEDNDEDEDLYELECPKCGEKVYFDFEEIENGDAVCPACGEPLEIELGEDDEDEEDGCGCGCCCEKADTDEDGK